MQPVKVCSPSSVHARVVTFAQNRDLWERVAQLLETHSKRKIEWQYVAGHKGNYGNEMADQLAKRGHER